MHQNASFFRSNECMVNKNNNFECRPPKGLFERIMANIGGRQLIITKRKIAIFSAGAVISVAVSIITFNILKSEFYHSGSVGFVSLAFSDPAYMVDVWEDYLMSILESFPVLSAVIFLSVTLVLLGLLRLLTQNIAAINIYSRFINKKIINQ